MPVKPVLMKQPFGDVVFTTEDEVLGLSNCTGEVADYCPNCSRFFTCRSHALSAS